MERREWFEIVMITLLSFGVIGLLLKGNQQQAELTLLKQKPSVTTQTETIKTELPNSLQNVLDSLTSRISTLETEEPGAVPSGQGGVTTTSTTNFQPQTIYLGSASTNQRDWTETGQQVTINSADYPSDVSATFEAGLSIVGGEAWARLKNKTTGAVMSVTEVFHNSPTITWKTSPGFKLHTGNYTYVVELKSSSGEAANLAGARIVIK